MELNHCTIWGKNERDQREVDLILSSKSGFSFVGDLLWTFARVSAHIYFFFWSGAPVFLFFFWRTTSFLIFLCILVKVRLTLLHSGLGVGCDSGLASQSLTLSRVTGMGVSPNQNQRETIRDVCWTCKYALATALNMWSCRLRAAGSHFLTIPIARSLRLKAVNVEDSGDPHSRI